MTITITVEKDGYYEVNGMRQEPSVSLYVIPAASKLRRMLKDTKEMIVCPGVYDGLSARIAMELGFKGMYMVRAFYSPPNHALRGLIRAIDRSWNDSISTWNG
jgi:methylisocitrate lyase